MIADIFERSAITAKRVTKQFPTAALDLLFPLSCVECQREGKVLCDSCAENLPELTSPYCPVCAEPDTHGTCQRCLEKPPAFDGIRAPYRMEGAIQEAIHHLKYRGLKVSAPQLSELLARYLAEHPLPGDILVPVPLHSRRLRHRGYNQSALLAKELAKRTGLETDQKLLTRNRNTTPQVNATRENRRENVRDSFQCAGLVTGQEVILVDDVATTGSTLSACAAALKAAGAKSVWGLVLARET